MRQMLWLVLAALLIALPVAAQPRESADLVKPYVKALESPRKDLRLEAIKKLGTLGRAASAAVPALATLLREADDTVAQAAAKALAQIGPPAVPDLVIAADAPKAGTRHRAVWALGQMGPDAARAVEVLQRALSDANPKLRAAAVHALGEIGPAAEPAIRDLFGRLGDPDLEVRRQAAQALQNAGAAAVPGIRELLQHDDFTIRLAAVQTALLLGPDAHALIPDLTRAVNDPNLGVQLSAVEALGLIGPSAKDAIPTLLEGLKSKQVEMQQHAFHSLLRIGAEDMPALLEEFRKINEQVHWAAKFVLGQFGPNPRDAVKPLTKHLESPDPGTRMSAALALGKIGPDAKDAVPALQKALKDPSPIVRNSVAFALGEINIDAQEARKKDFLNALEQIEKNVALSNQRMQELHRGMLVDLTKPARPLSRPALFNPQLQMQYNQVIDMQIMVSVQQNARPKGPARQQLRDLQTAVSDAMKKFEPEAVPAVMRGMHMTAAYDLGFC